jgi:hypothetical protein
MGDTLGAVAALLPGVRIERPGRSAGRSGPRCCGCALPGRAGLGRGC